MLPAYTYADYGQCLSLYNFRFTTIVVPFNVYMRVHVLQMHYLLSFKWLYRCYFVLIDVSPFYYAHDARVVAAAVNKYIHVRYRESLVNKIKEVNKKAFALLIM